MRMTAGVASTAPPMMPATATGDGGRSDSGHEVLVERWLHGASGWHNVDARRRHGRRHAPGWRKIGATSRTRAGSDYAPRCRRSSAHGMASKAPAPVSVAATEVADATTRDGPTRGTLGSAADTRRWSGVAGGDVQRTPAGPARRCTVPSGHRNILW